MTIRQNEKPKGVAETHKTNTEIEDLKCPYTAKRLVLKLLEHTIDTRQISSTLNAMNVTKKM